MAEKIKTGKTRLWGNKEIGIRYQIQLMDPYTGERTWVDGKPPKKCPFCDGKGVVEDEDEEGPL